jgi:glutathione S-transferase
MTYQLYNRTGSGGFAVESALVLAGAPFELVDLGSKPGTPLPDEFRKTNPWGQVPTLILPDGSTMTECAAILIHLAACFPEKNLAPLPGSSEHAAFLRWTIFSSVNVYESILRRGYPFRFTSDPEAIEATQTAAIVRLSEAVAVLEDTIVAGPFLLGPSLSVADPYIAMLFLWSRVKIETPRLTALADGVRQHPIVGPVWRRHFGDR